MANARPQTGYATVNGISLYYEMHGDGPPLVLLHGGFGLTGMFGPLLPQLAHKRQVIAVDLQGHGRTADIDRPLRPELMADDVAGLLNHLGLAKADVMGYSMGGAVALRMAIQHPQRVDRLVAVSTFFSRHGLYPEVRQNMTTLGPESVEFLKSSPLYKAYTAVAPQPENFPRLVAKMGDLLRQEYDWSKEVSELKMPVPMRGRRAFLRSLSRVKCLNFVERMVWMMRWSLVMMPFLSHVCVSKLDVGNALLLLSLSPLLHTH